MKKIIIILLIFLTGCTYFRKKEFNSVPSIFPTLKYLQTNTPIINLPLIKTPTISYPISIPISTPTPTLTQTFIPTTTSLKIEYNIYELYNAIKQKRQENPDETIYFTSNTNIENIEKQKITEISRKNNEKYIYILDGYTDKSRNNEQNLLLGLKRAEKIKELLVENNINASNIFTDTFGNQNAKNNNEKDRRVEIRIIKN